MKFMVCAPVLSVLVSGVATTAAAMTPAQIFKAASPSVVTIHVYDVRREQIAQGSGVVVAHGRVITNCHLFEGMESVQVGQRTLRVPAFRTRSDSERDLCAVSAPDLTIPAAVIGSSDAVEIGDPLYAIGAPQGFELTLSDGLLSGRRGADGEYLLQITTPISPGSSGGGLFNVEGELIGITTLFYKESQQINFAVPVEWLADLAKKPDLSDTSSYSTAISRAASITADAAIAAEPVDTRSQAGSGSRKKVYRYMLGKSRHYSTTVPAGATDVSLVTSSSKPTASNVRSAWETTYSDGDGVYSFRRDAMQRVAGEVSGWERAQWVKPAKIGSYGNVFAYQTRMRYNCSDRNSSMGDYILYDETGNVLDSTHSETYGLKRAILPDSIREVVYDHLCASQ